jgi:hypothetical protein
MRLRPLCAVVLMSLLVPTAAQAHDHVWDFSFGPAAATGSRLWGGRFSIGLTNKVPANKDLSWLIDVTNVKGKDGTDDIVQLSYLGGVRYAILGNRQTDKSVVLVHGLVGRFYKQTGATGVGEWSATVGGAFEQVLTHGWAARVQVEHSFVKNVKGYTQVSLGAVKRFN